MKQCPCCDFFTIEDDFDICEVCYWAYDLTAQNNPDIAIGPNSVSLNQAIRNYKKYGASEKKFINKVRKPDSEELPENN
ncbi:CPCC family cysteine-rich protein [Bacillus sp. DX1.1]|uniref:CPCC family cysteine-rich protein n=1 Tax=unclassified Bacillus (in: firmicutes) TaxID=185979 RepID=UPI0025704BDC|nr:MULTISPECIES: CPCC family cysteine-rich protein [unclassified Bacillus (in: firmicutes)]MDM5153729.1 CPCC family cysteine-rich protein [Bacillus sp. DX1.1]WJE82666.1 CPCC family cysteine-rich protein [Bacillus sp. DX3.1]